MIARAQDKDGLPVIFYLSRKQIIKEIRFSGQSIYDGIAIAGQDAYTLESSALVYHLSNYFNSNFSVKKTKTFLEKKWDAEGSCCGEIDGYLLIAWKESIANDQKDLEIIFSFDFKEEKIIEAPAFHIQIKDLPKKLESDKIFDFTLTICELIDQKWPSGILIPSAIAIHLIRNTTFYFVFLKQIGVGSR